MWLLKCTIEDSVVTEQALRYDSTVRVGRHPTYENDPNAIHLAGMRLSKRQFSIHVGKPSHINDVENQTPLALEFESTAITKVNDQKYHLVNRDDDPVTQDFTHNLIIRIVMKYSKNETARLEIKWIPINISSYAKKIMANNEIRESPLPAKIQELYDGKIDIRATGDALIATHYVTLTDLDNIQLRIALSRAIPILNLDWLETIRDEFASLHKWFHSPESHTAFLPRAMHGDNQYLVPDNNRSLLFENCLIVLFNDISESSKKFKKLTAQISCLSANTVILDTPKYYDGGTLDEKNLEEDIKLELQQYDNKVSCYIAFQTVSAEDSSFSSLVDKFTKTHGGELVSDSKLFECIRSSSIDSLRAITLGTEPNHKRHSMSQSSPGDSQLKLTQRRKRRKIEKASGLDFFDFTASPAPPTPSISKSPLEPSPLSRDLLESAPSSKNDDQESSISSGIHTSKNDTAKDASQSPVVDESTRGTKDTNSNSVDENVNSVPDEPSKGVTTKRDHSALEPVANNENEPAANSESEPAAKKVKLSEPVKKLSKFMPQVSLVDAIRSTKSEQAATAKKELGIHEDDSSQPLNEKLHNLALVETIEVQLRKPPSKHTDDQSKFSGRTNFKKFHKKQNVKSNLTRSFIDLQPVAVDQVTFKSTTQEARDAVQLAEQGMSQDFDGIMADIRGYKPVNPRISLTDHTAVEPVNEEIGFDDNDDDDDDIEGGFSFRTSKNDSGRTQSSLFVPADSQTLSTPSHSREPASMRKSNGSDAARSRPPKTDLDDDDDDDDDDDEPRFAFSRA